MEGIIIAEIFNDVVTLRDVWQAHKRIYSSIDPTPLHHSMNISMDQNANVLMKLESMHEIGSFKIRGATNKLLSLTKEQRERGVVSFSTGNHGLAVAYMGKKLGIKTVICISNRVPINKVERLKLYGANVCKVGNNQDDAEKYAYKLSEKEGLTIIPPFDDREVIAGQGTIGIELLQAIPTVDTVIIPVSGGGLFAGISLVLRQYYPEIKLIGVSMKGSPAMFESIKQGKIVTLQEKDTLADSLLGGIGTQNKYTYHMVQRYIDDFILLTEEEIAFGMAYLLTEHQLAVEGAAATSIAAILSNKVSVKGKNVATIITGRNVDAASLCKVSQNYM